MKTSYWYYGIHPNEFKNLPYEKALQVKRTAAKSLLEKLAAYDITDPRIGDVLSAIKDIDKLLAELLIPTVALEVDFTEPDEEDILPKHATIEEFIYPQSDELDIN